MSSKSTSIVEKLVRASFNPHDFIGLPTIWAYLPMSLAKKRPAELTVAMWNGCDLYSRGMLVFFNAVIWTLSAILSALSIWITIQGAKNTIAKLFFTFTFAFFFVGVVYWQAFLRWMIKNFRKSNK